MKHITRRRFLNISAVAVGAATLSPLALSSIEKPLLWQGRVLGAEASISFQGGGERRQAALKEALQVVQKYEKQFSIYDPTSSLSRLNAEGILDYASVGKNNNQENNNQGIVEILTASKAIHQQTEGLFDPTVQPLFAAYAQSNRGAKTKGDPALVPLVPSKQVIDKALTLVGLDGVEVESNGIIRYKKARMAMTFNGIAQGFITDQVRQVLNKHGFKDCLINMGEYSAGDQEAQIGVADAMGRVFDVAKLRNQAIATSSPRGYQFADGTSHIFHPNGKRYHAHWDTVSVVADNATDADGYSTALALTQDQNLAKRLVANGLVNEVILKDAQGRVYKI